MPREPTIVPALVGRKEAAMILGVQPQNVGRIRGLPTPLGDGVEGFEVSSGPLWLRGDIVALAKERSRAKAPHGRPRGRKGKKFRATRS
jgi:hypothetical protein